MLNELCQCKEVDKNRDNQDFDPSANSLGNIAGTMRHQFAARLQCFTSGQNWQKQNAQKGLHNLSPNVSGRRSGEIYAALKGLHLSVRKLFPLALIALNRWKSGMVEKVRAVAALYDVISLKASQSVYLGCSETAQRL